MSSNVRVTKPATNAAPPSNSLAPHANRYSHAANTASSSFVLDVKDSTTTRLSNQQPPSTTYPDGNPTPRVAADGQPPRSVDARHSSPSIWTRVRRDVASWRRGTVSIHDVDPWLQFNVYVRRGFRHCRLRKREALGSVVLYFHNESFNIFSHFIAALVMLSLLWWPPRVLLLGGSEDNTGSSGGLLQSVYTGAGGSERAAHEPEDLWFASAAAADSRARQVPRRDGGRETNNQNPNMRHLNSRRGLEDTGYRPSQEQQHQMPNWLSSLHGQAPAAQDATLSAATAAAAARPSSGRETAGRKVSLADLRRSDEDEEWMDGVDVKQAYVPQGGATSPRDGILTANTAAHITTAARLSFSIQPVTWCLFLTFVLSCVYHIFMPCCCSRRGYQQLLQCDVMGVLLSIGGSAYAYLTCGMPCASDTTVGYATGLVFFSTLLCLYVVVLAPMWGVLTELCHAAWETVQKVLALGVAAVLEFVMQHPLPQPPFTQVSVEQRQNPLPAQQHQQQSGQNMRSRRQQEQRAQGTNGESRRTVQRRPSAAYRAFFTWLHEHRLACKKHCSDEFNITASTDFPSQHNTERAPSRQGTTRAAAAAAEPVHITAHQRAAVMGVYCLLHLGIYLWYVHPKSKAVHGGFTQGVYYHNLSYMWLFVGGAVNAARFPERVVFHWTRKAAKHTRKIASEEAAAWCAAELARSTDGAAGATAVASMKVPTWWQRFSLPKLMISYVLSASTLDYVGNSHNLWHICTMLSAFSTVLAVYYDCMEYDLVVCG